MAANEQDVKHPHLVELLASRMRATGITPKDIREECNVDAETVRLWMRGKRMPRDKELRKLAKMLDVDVAAYIFATERAGTIDESSVTMASAEAMAEFERAQKQQGKDVAKRL